MDSLLSQVVASNLHCVEGNVRAEGAWGKSQMSKSK